MRAPRRRRRIDGPRRGAARPGAYDSYAALLADPEIEAIYNPLPDHLHVPLTLQAAGKVLIAEAFMVRFHPQWLRARELVREGRIGTLRAVQMFFGCNNVDPANVRNKADIAVRGEIALPYGVEDAIASVTRRWSRLRDARGTLSPPALGGSVAMRIRPIIHDTGGTRWRSC